MERRSTGLDASALSKAPPYQPGYPDLVATGGTVLNQTGQAVEIVSIWMAVYLSLSLFTSSLMNWFNARIALTER